MRVQDLRAHAAAMALACAATFGGMPAAAASAVVGQAAPEFTATDLDGRQVRLADFRGKYVVLEWTNPGCPFVRKHYQQSGNMPALQKEFTARGVAWLAVNSTEPGHQDYLPAAQLSKWFADQGARPTVALMDESGTVGRAYGARTTPHMYIVDPAGKLVVRGGHRQHPLGGRRRHQGRDELRPRGARAGTGWQADHHPDQHAVRLLGQVRALSAAIADGSPGSAWPARRSRARRTAPTPRARRHPTRGRSAPPGRSTLRRAFEAG